MLTFNYILNHYFYTCRVSGVDIQTQEAYELAVRGLLRPRAGQESNPMIYGIKCIEYDLPNFTLGKSSCLSVC